MGLFDKFKNLFTDDSEDEIIPEVEVKKEVLHVEIPGPKKREEVAPPEPEVKIVEEIKPIESRRSTPVLFEDKDFDIVDYQEKNQMEVPVTTNYEGKYAIKKQKPAPVEEKVFSPTPIISPIYGVLDRNYKKEDIKNKKNPLAEYEATNISLDDVMAKAHRSFDKNLENDFFAYQEKEMIVNSDESLKEELMTRTLKNEEILASKGLSVKDADKEANVDTSEFDLFNLIDQMYERGEDNE